MSRPTLARREFGLAALASAIGLGQLRAQYAGQDATPSATDAVHAACTHKDRIEMDLRRDATRKPEQIMNFFQIKPGQQVADIQGGNGYYTELMSRIVGKKGKVIAVNADITQRLYGKQLTERLQRKEFDASNIVRVDKDLHEMSLPKAGLDRALLVRFYHDFGWMEQDRAVFNRDVFDSLKPGGVFGVIDHHAKEGAGMSVGGSLHRIEASLVRKEVEAAGFKLEAESYVLNDPTDGHDFNIFADNQARRDKTDRFVYFFRKPV